MKKVILIALLAGSTIAASAHNELVGTFVFAQLSDCSLLLTATVEKRHLAHALRNEGDCTLREMMTVCGNQYLIDNFMVLINKEKMNLRQEGIEIGKENVTLTYTIDLSDTQVEEVKVIGDYMFPYNDHSILKVVFDFKGPTRIFNIKNKKRAITAKF